MKKAAIFLFLLSSCQSKPDLFEKELTARTIYWEFLRSESIGRFDTTYVSVTRFSADNTYKSFLLRNGKLEDLPNIDSPTQERKWQYTHADSTLIIDENTFKLKVKGVRKDTVYLADSSGVIYLLVKKHISHPVL